MLRIGKTRDKSKVGVFIYCQEHAREWGTPLVCLETAERLIRNYGSDPETTSLVDNLDIFIVPTINADGAAYSMYDFNSQRRNMVNYCASNPTGNNDPYARNGWGVDLNRNFSVGSFYDGFQGASNGCTSDTFAGPSEMSEPEVRNEAWVQSTYRNIKFAMNVHSSGGYFMWPPGAYKPTTREPLPYPPYGTLNYFDQTASQVLDRIYNFRHTAVLPQQTGPVLDVLYSAAGNSADEAYYNHGIIGYDFEIGASKVLADGSSVGTGFQPPYSTVDTVRRHGLLQRRPRQRGPRRGHGVRQRQLRAARLGAAVRARHEGADGHRERRQRGQRRAGREVHVRRGGVDLLHARRLDAHDGLHRVEAEPAA